MMIIYDMRVNHVKEPLGFDLSNLHFSWKAAGLAQGHGLRANRITVREAGRTIYQSEPDSLLQFHEHRASLNLKPRMAYSWCVELEDDLGECTVAESTFETGKLDEAWYGRWIAADAELEGSVLLSEKFVLSDEMTGEDGRVYISGLGLFECYLNGQKVSDEYLAPGYHSYDFHIQVATYDVSDLLRTGENTLEIALGDGWYKGRLGFDGGFTNLYGDTLMAVAELYVGGELVCSTDKSWTAKLHPVTFSNIYDGEIFDARREDDTATFKVKVVEPENLGPLVDRLSLPIVQKEVLPVRELIHTPKGETVLDFGQNLAGWIEGKVDLPAGWKLRFKAGEILQEGCFYNENYRTAQAQYTYISKGAVAYFRPHFTFYAFRYLLAEIDPGTGEWRALQEDDQVSDLRACHLRSDFDEIGSVETGNSKVNQLISNVFWVQKDNFLDIPTDCPQRDERLGWTGDAQVFSATASYNMYTPAFFRKYFWDMRAEQSIIDGAVPNTVPRLKQGLVAGFASSPWADAATIIPWTIFKHYGSVSLLEETYPSMRDWIDYQSRQAAAQGRTDFIDSGFHFADWLALDNPEPGPFGKTDPHFIASVYYMHGAALTAEAADRLGYTEDQERFAALAGRVRKVLLETYFDEMGNVKIDTQTASAMAIQFGLVEGEAKVREGAKLTQLIEAAGGHLTTGFVGTPLLLPALTAVGAHSTAVDLLLNEEYPGWLYCVNLGATTIWERWNSVLPDGSMNPEGMNSLNHYAYGSVMAWIYEELMGLKPLEPGFTKAILAPKPDRRLGHLKGKLDSAAGLYRSEWLYDEAGDLHYEFEIPYGCEAEVSLVDGRTFSLQHGMYKF